MVSVEQKNIDEDLDYMFTPSRWVVRMKQDEVVEDFVTSVSKAREELLLSPTVEKELDIVYFTEGDTKCCVDIYKPNKAATDAPVVLFIHGGYWQECSKIHGAFPARSLIKNGIITVAVGYTIAPEGKKVKKY
ncbi:kynurenine formamidase-like [Saccoglossus kowalevskii]|uniref:Kynurenine formamidase-like n=1 Tax=Saccoglossus kowalevskii TaxID=10224 RepID=A0ABM0MXA7_SACKO|nr:PREDICTED: kynurenine formamidase-like [Saccoglossus kowalevskii]